jgi:hypothetical protein
LKLQFRSWKENSNKEINYNLNEAITVIWMTDRLNISKKSNLTEQRQMIGHTTFVCSKHHFVPFMSFTDTTPRKKRDTDPSFPW